MQEVGEWKRARTSEASERISGSLASRHSRSASAGVMRSRASTLRRIAERDADDVLTRPFYFVAAAHEAGAYDVRYRLGGHLHLTPRAHRNLHE